MQLLRRRNEGEPISAMLEWAWLPGYYVGLYTRWAVVRWRFKRKPHLKVSW